MKSTVPAYTAGLHLPAESTRSHKEVMSLRVFLVEDARNMHVMLAELLAAVGTMTLVGAARTEAEALFWLEGNAGNWDILIADLILEQGSGIGVVARAKATHPNGRIVVFSGYVSPAISEHLKDLGAQAVFDKADTTAFTKWLLDLDAARPVASDGPKGEAPAV